MGIVGTWVPASGTLTLTGVSSWANYQAALQSITYANTSDNPSTAPRTVTFTVNDGAYTSVPAARQIDVTAVNDAPLNTAPGPQNVNQDTTLVFSTGNGNAIGVSDIDAGANPVQITLTATHGLLTLSGTRRALVLRGRRHGRCEHDLPRHAGGRQRRPPGPELRAQQRLLGLGVDHAGHQRPRGGAVPAAPCPTRTSSRSPSCPPAASPARCSTTWTGTRTSARGGRCGSRMRRS